LHHHEIILLPIKFDEYVGPWDTQVLPKILQVGEQAVARKKAEILNVIHSFAGGAR